MNQEFNDRIAGGVAGRDIYQGPVTKTNIHALVCPGLHACLHDRGEDDYQRKFEENTGISCGKPARIVLQYLLDVGHFDRKHLALAWRMKAILWDWDQLRLASNVSRFEMFYGYFLMALGAISFLGFFIGALLGQLSAQPIAAVQATATALVFAAMVPFAEKYLLRPNRIAIRAKPVIEAYYETRSDLSTRADDAGH